MEGKEKRSKDLHNGSGAKEEPTQPPQTQAGEDHMAIDELKADGDAKDNDTQVTEVCVGRKSNGSSAKVANKLKALEKQVSKSWLSDSESEDWEDGTPLQQATFNGVRGAACAAIRCYCRGVSDWGRHDFSDEWCCFADRDSVLCSHTTELLGLQIDAAINSGNSGVPVFNDKGTCVGIAFKSLKHEDAENIGYVIPTPVIMHFIKDYEKNGAYTGFPILGIEWQKMENPDLRASMGMEPDQKGVRIRRIDPTALEFQVLKPSDILLCFDGVNIANDGTVPFRHGERIGFSYLISQKYTGDNSKVKVLRSSEILNFDIKLGSHKKLIPSHIKGRPPSYYIVAGFVFTAVSVPYLRSEYGKDYEFEAPVKLLDKMLHSLRQSPDEQLVVVSQVLVADINIGYEDIVNTQVLAFNGKPVKNLKSLASMVENCEDEFLTFDLEYKQVAVLRTDTAKAATLDILATHCIPSAMSDDLKT